MQRQEARSNAPTDEELIIKEARRRQRHRRLVIGLATLVLLGGLIGAVVVLSLGSSDPVHQPTPVLPSLPTAAPTPSGVIPQVAWSDYQGQLHIGDLSGLGERVVAQTDADPTASLVVVGGGIFWVRSEYPTPDQTVDPIADSTVQRFDLATGTTTTLGPGSQVFAAPDGSRVYVATSADELVEYTPGGVPIGHDLRVPAGWFLSDPSLLGNPVPVTANGVLVMSAPQQILRNPSTLGLWNPDTGRVRTIGKVWKVIGTYTRPGDPEQPDRLGARELRKGSKLPTRDHRFVDAGDSLGVQPVRTGIRLGWWLFARRVGAGGLRARSFSPQPDGAARAHHWRGSCSAGARGDDQPWGRPGMG